MPASTSMAVLFAAFVGLFAGVNNGANAQTYPSGPVSFERFDLSPAQFSQLIQDDLEHWGALVKADGAWKIVGLRTGWPARAAPPFTIPRAQASQ